ncbi:hypothetical protein C8Q79DRAFT_930663 [Trametes meyenii]|nr:hypothetical protein C8Q79DRAFT_930663 [Trametes meyenii]
MALTQLARVEEGLQEVSASLLKPSKDVLQASEQRFNQFVEVYRSVRRVTPTIEEHKKLIKASIKCIQKRIQKLKMCYPPNTDQGPVFHDSSSHYNLPVDQYHVVAQVAMFLGIVLHVLGKLGRSASDFLLCSMSLLVGLSFDASSPAARADPTSIQEVILCQIPRTVNTAMDQFNLSAQTTTWGKRAMSGR